MLARLCALANPSTLPQGNKEQLPRGVRENTELHARAGARSRIDRKTHGVVCSKHRDSGVVARGHEEKRLAHKEARRAFASKEQACRVARPLRMRAERAKDEIDEGNYTDVK